MRGRSDYENSGDLHRRYRPYPHSGGRCCNGDVTWRVPFIRYMPLCTYGTRVPYGRSGALDHSIWVNFIVKPIGL